MTSCWVAGGLVIALSVGLAIQAAPVRAQPRTSMFDFQDNFWLNLHQFVRGDQLTPVERSALEREWQPYLDAKVSFEQAMHDLLVGVYRRTPSRT